MNDNELWVRWDAIQFFEKIGVGVHICAFVCVCACVRACASENLYVRVCYVDVVIAEREKLVLQWIAKRDIMQNLSEIITKLEIFLYLLQTVALTQNQTVTNVQNQNSEFVNLADDTSCYFKNWIFYYTHEKLELKKYLKKVKKIHFKA